MRILIYGINYAPELTGIGKYTGEMGKWLAGQGHTVKVITAMPYYPEWSVHKKYKGRWWHKENIDGAIVYRCPLYVPKKISSAKRILHEFSFLASIFPIWLLTLFQKKYDIVICVSPPFHLGFLPLLYAKIRNANLVTHIQDLQVDAAKNLAMLKNGRMLNMMFGAEKFILKRSTAVSTISKGMLNKIIHKDIQSLKTILFPNWMDDTHVTPICRSQSLRPELGINDSDKVVLYSGNLGEKQGLEIIVDVAKNFKHRNDVRFVIVGSGGNKDKLETLVKKASLKNVSFFPLVAAEKLSSLLAIADLHLVLQKNSASDLMMPSKLINILAAGGCPVVTALPGTSLYDLISENKLGILVEPESATHLTTALLRALEEDLAGYRENARQFAVRNLSRETIMRDFESELYKLVAQSNPAVQAKRVSYKQPMVSTD